MNYQIHGRLRQENETFKASVDYSEFKANLSNLVRICLKIMILRGAARDIVGNLPSICELYLNSIPNTIAAEQGGGKRGGVAGREREVI